MFNAMTKLCPESANDFFVASDDHSTMLYASRTGYFLRIPKLTG